MTAAPTCHAIARAAERYGIGLTLRDLDGLAGAIHCCAPQTRR